MPNGSHKIEEQNLERGLDCVVSTMERLQLRRDRQKIFLSHLSTIVIDEFDTLVDSGLEDRIRSLLD